MLALILGLALFGSGYQAQKKYDYCKKIEYKGDYCKFQKKLSKYDK